MVRIGKELNLNLNLEIWNGTERAGIVAADLRRDVEKVSELYLQNLCAFVQTE